MLARLTALVLLALVVVGSVPALRRRLDAALARALGGTGTGAATGRGAGLYDRLAGTFLGGLYRDIAAEALRAVATVDRPEVLEIGPGPGHLGELLLLGRGDLRLVALDVDPGMLEAAGTRLARARVRERANLVQGDVVAMPFGDAAFDLVVTSLSAHHWADPVAAFREVRRVLRPGGRALCYDLPAWWGSVEAGSAGLDAAADVFEEAEASNLRALGSIPVVRRLELRLPKTVSGLTADEPVLTRSSPQ